MSLNNTKIYYALRFASAMCFIGHGAFGIITKQIWCNYFAVFGMGHDLAYQLMPILGVIDILIGISLLIYPTRAVLLWLVIWGVTTALLRPLSGEPFAETIERAGNYGARYQPRGAFGCAIRHKAFAGAKIDHTGRPTPPAGLDQPAFAAILRMAQTGRVNVKISGYQKFATRHYPFEDCWPFVRAIVDAFTLDRCMWASDWPFLRASERQDYGPLVQLAGQLFPDANDRRKLFWDTPNRLFNFAR